jgi:hypothetical protein
MGCCRDTMMNCVRWLTRFAWVIALLLWSQPSQAYPWMVKHQYTGCAVCHVDPSGGYLLTEYGRAQTQALLSTLGKGPEGDEVDSRSRFAFGALPPSKWLNLGATAREAFFWNKPVQPSSPAISQWLLMQADFRAAVTVGRVIATGSIGFLQLKRGPNAAQLTTGNQNVAVSREYWLGVQLGEDRNTVVRAGRMNLPFGIRDIVHPFYVRTNTGTNIDYQQQVGLSIFHEVEKYRFEIMAIAGNYQIAPDDYRERGYSGYAEFNVGSAAQVGFSSKVTRAKLRQDGATFDRNAYFGAHGPMLRWSPAEPLAILAEVDLLHLASTGVLTKYGLAAMAQVDLEMTRGLHAMVTGELYHGPELDDAGGHHFFNRDWLSFVWFAYPHIDVRVDSFWATEEFAPPDRVNSLGALGMLHVSL